MKYDFNYLNNEKIENDSIDNVLKDLKNGTPIKKNIIPKYEKFFKSDNGFGIYKCYDANDDTENTFTIKGNFISELIIGQTYEIEGKICTNTYLGIDEKQININKIHVIKPVNKKGIISYLQTLKGLKSKANLIYDVYKEDSIEILIKDPLEVVKRIKGIGKKNALSWQEQLKALQGSQATITRLLDYGLTIKQSRKLYNQYNDKIIDMIEKNPYCLAHEVKGYAFKSCDRIAKNMGYDLRSRFRISEGIMFVLNEASFEGHCYLPLDVLIERTQDALSCKLTVNEMIEISKSNNEFEEYYVGLQKFNVDVNKVKELLNLYRNEKDYNKKEKFKYKLLDIEEYEIVLQFEELKEKNRIIIEQKDNEKNEDTINNNYKNIKVYLINLYYDELSVTYNILRLSNEEKFNNLFKLEEELDYYLKNNKISLEDKQREAVLNFANTKGGFYVLNGSAGCGKTFTLKIILDMLRLQFQKSYVKFKVLAFAPTGKASKVAAKATQLPCCTVHRGLGYNPTEGFTFNKTNPLDANVVLIDESSMLDITLTKYLLEAIKNGTKVIFIGDIKQLPSVGPGNVLKDIIESGEVKTTTLNVVKRQDLLSDILRNANNIINKLMLVNYNNTKDAFVMFKENPYDVQDYIIRSIKRIQKIKNFDLEDIQVLCPQKNSLIGTIIMNYIIQQEFNPDNNEVVALNKKFELKTRTEHKEVCLYYKKNDKVIHIKNNYDMEWYVKDNFGKYIKDDEFTGITNGETGVIEDIVKEKDINGDLFTRIIVKYDNKYVFYDDVFDELEHAYALTIHKSQGSQWKAVVIPIMNLNFIMLDNNLLYTAYTRAEEFNVVIGQKSAISYAIKNSKIITRYTSLKDRLINGI